MMKWYGKTSTRVIEILNSDMSFGLTEEKIKHMRETYGDNIILKPEISSILSLIISEIRQLWMIVSLCFVAMLYYNGMQIIAIIAMSITIISTSLLVRMNYKKEKSLMSVDNLNTPFSYVIRSGKLCKINCEEIVVGDIVLLEKDCSVPADIRIIEGQDLKVREVAVTGEKYEVEKYHMMIEGEVANLSEIKNIVFKSSIVTNGEGLGIVIDTGMNTQIGKILKVLLEHKTSNIGFSKSLTKIFNKLALLIVIVDIITLVLALQNNVDTHEIINILIYIGMTFNLPMFIVILWAYFDILVFKFKKKNIYIKDISAIYALTKVSTIFMKKLGAISENKLVFRELYCDNTVNFVQNKNLNIDSTVKRIVSIAVLCNDSKLYIDGEKCSENIYTMQELAEQTILKFCSEEFTEIYKIESKQKRIFQIPYDSDKRIKTVVNKIEDRFRANVAGSLDKIINKCTHILINGVEMELKDTDIQNIIDVHIGMSNKSYNVVALAYRNFTYEPSIDENIESNLVFVGLIGLENPIKDKSYEAIQSCKNINIKLIIDEEENKLAAFAFGKQVGLVSRKEEVLSGIEMDHMSKEELEKNIEDVIIFSKVTTNNKSDIVKSLNAKGHCIASIGDSLTDLEYLNNSQISISVGSECSRIVKKLSSLFLEENDFSEIINLVKQSKTIINYVSKLVLFMCAAGLSQIFILLISLVFAGEIPFALIETLYLNFIIIPICGISILFQNKKSRVEDNSIYPKQIRKVVIKNSFIVTCIYFIIFTFINMLDITNFRQISFIILGVYENIFSLRLLEQKKILKNKISYILIVINLLLLSVFILNLTK